jgi:hypothetical protein
MTCPKSSRRPFTMTPALGAELLDVLDNTNAETIN